LIRTVIRLIVAVAVLNAAVRVGFAWWNYYQLKDTAQQLIVFEFDKPTRDISKEILEAAMELSVPLEAENLEVIREGTMTFVNVWYLQPVEVFPNFRYPVEMSFFVQARALH
jgi:hypothetical protein